MESILRELKDLQLVPCPIPVITGPEDDDSVEPITQLLIGVCYAGALEEDEARQNTIADAHTALIVEIMKSPELTSSVLVDLQEMVLCLWHVVESIAEAQSTTTDALMLEAGFTR